MRKTFSNFWKKQIQKNCKIVLLTARNPDLKDITLTHLKQLNIELDEIYFNENKGEELLSIVSTQNNKYKNIIFVDDLLSNLEDVANSFKDKNIYNLFLYLKISN